MCAPEPQAVYAGRSTLEVFIAWAMLWACARPWVLGPALWTLRRASGAWWGRPVNALMLRLVFPHYCAGEGLGDCKRVAGLFRGAGGVRLVVDHSQEERSEPEDWARNLAGKVRLLGELRSELGDCVPFVPFKPTSIVSPPLLERLSALIIQADDWESAVVHPTERLGAADRQLLAIADAHLAELCEAGRAHGIALWMDAEQSHRQPAIEFLARRAMQRYNSLGHPPVLFNTYQLYLVGAERRLARDLAHAQEHDYAFAAKCVRGAYMVAEAERAQSKGLPSPLHATKAATDRAYDGAVAAMLEAVASPKAEASVAICTHSMESVSAAVSKLAALGLPPGSPRVHFAQILGMSDHVTGALSAAGHRAHKLVLFGDFAEVFPWLLRRLDENRDMLGACQTERPVLVRELRRRAGLPF